MKEIYDILTNFQKKAYEIYEWDKKDDIEHIKRIFAFKVSSKVIYDFINNDLIVDIEFLKKIKNKTKLFSNKLINTIEYACVLCDSNLAVAFEFDKDGKILGRSKLLFEESDDVVITCEKEKINVIDYKIIKKLNKDCFYTRKEKKIVDTLIIYLNKIYKEKKYEEIKYLYYECFNKNENNVKFELKKLKENIKELNYNIINSLLSVVILLEK